jgi:hypothetical protein
MTYPLDQLARLNDWLAEYEPDLYRGTPDLDTADVVIDLLNRGRAGHGVLPLAATVTAAPVGLFDNVDGGRR